ATTGRGSGATGLRLADRSSTSWAATPRAAATAAPSPPCTPAGGTTAAPDPGRRAEVPVVTTGARPDVRSSPAGAGCDGGVDGPGETGSPPRAGTAEVGGLALVRTDNADRIGRGPGGDQAGVDESLDLGLGGRADRVDQRGIGEPLGHEG